MGLGSMGMAMSESSVFVVGSEFESEIETGTRVSSATGESESCVIGFWVVEVVWEEGQMGRPRSILSTRRPQACFTLSSRSSSTSWRLRKGDEGRKYPGSSVKW